jgi:phosphonate transport system permease protein
VSFARPTAAELTQLSARHPDIFREPLALRLRRYALLGALALLLAFCLQRTGFADLSAIAKGLGRLGEVLAFMLPPRAGGYLGEFLLATLETLSMAFLGTLIAFLCALPLGFLGATNVVANPFVHFGLRRLFDTLRGVDALIWALIFINVVGLGPFAGILAIGVSDAGVLAKLFAEAVENIDPRQAEGVRASGAGRLAVIRFGMLPQVLPVLLSNALYYFESNTRSATILGIVGAGGIGLQLSDRIRINEWDQASCIILIILITVFLIDKLSSSLRHAVIGRRS